MLENRSTAIPLAAGPQPIQQFRLKTTETAGPNQELTVRVSTFVEPLRANVSANQVKATTAGPR
ncbi:hypothetical protein, partial [Escherichia coli]|uniref:hypothetical protein n=1 Tax=Escherichia coli TaxID=562 RepID=UPI00195466B5